MVPDRYQRGVQTIFRRGGVLAATLTVSGLLVSCGKPEAPPETEGDEDRTIRELRTEIDELKRHHERQTDQLAAAIRDRYEEQIQAVRSELEAKSGAYEATVRNLELTIARQEDRIRKMQAPPAPADDDSKAQAVDVPSTAIRISRYEPPLPDVSDFILVPTGPNPDLFPVEVTNVTGRMVVIGTHISKRLSPIGEEYRDSFGETKRRLVEEEYEVNDYSYQVVCTLRNRTRQSQTVSVRAGHPPIPFDLGPGEDREVSIDWKVGASLTVAESGFSRSYPVAVEEE